MAEVYFVRRTETTIVEFFLVRSIIWRTGTLLISNRMSVWICVVVMCNLWGGFEGCFFLVVKFRVCPIVCV